MWPPSILSFTLRFEGFVSVLLTFQRGEMGGLGSDPWSLARMVRIGEGWISCLIMRRKWA